MKNVSSFKLALTYAGCFVGAGFLSGQELWQFFGTFGKLGWLGLIIAIFLQGLLGFVVISYAKRKKEEKFDQLIVPSEKLKVFRAFFAVCEVVFVFFVVTIMCAGAGSVINGVTGLPKFLGSLVFIVIVGIVAYFGLKGVVKIFNLSVPLLIVATLFVCIFTLCKYGYPNFNAINPKPVSWFLPNFIVSAILFSTYNVFCTLGIIVPVSSKVKSNGVTVTAMAIASIVLTIIAVCVLIPLSSRFEYAKFDFPMLEMARSISAIYLVFYSILMLMGIFGTALSSTVSIVEFVSLKVNPSKKTKIITVVIIAVLAFVLSLIGFSELISVLYPICGYVGVIAMVILIIGYLKGLKKKAD